MVRYPGDKEQDAASSEAGAACDYKLDLSLRMAVDRAARIGPQSVVAASSRAEKV